jgi:hypothetical protein
VVEQRRVVLVDDGCSAGLSAARKQAGRRLRGLTETGETRTARCAVREGGSSWPACSVRSRVNTQWTGGWASVRSNAAGNSPRGLKRSDGSEGCLELLRGRDGAMQKQQRCSSSIDGRGGCAFNAR